MKYVVFLRGINVGGRIVKMAELKTCLEKAGLKNVKTILQTGNVIFECDKTDISKLKQMIEAALTKSFNYPAKVQVFPAESLHKIIKGYPFGIAGVIFIILIALLVAVIKIRNKVNRITAAIEDKINTVTTIAEKTGEVAAIATGAVARKAKRALGKK
jgi:uncharacterized protein (DUF1697 family)